MNQEIKKEWVDALRSGKYKQGIQNLNLEEEYCCLGVLCDLVKDKLGVEWQLIENGAYGFLGDTAFLPPSVQDFCGLQESDPHIELTPELQTKYDSTDISLSYLNDSGANFDEIADLIEQQL